MTRFRYWNTRLVRYPLLVVVSLASLIVTGVNCGLSKSDWAAWVQAIGSIGAIIGAYVIGERQARHARQVALDLHEAAGRDRRKAILEICRLSLSRTKLVERVFLDGYDHSRRKTQYDHSLVHTVQALLDTVQPAELRDYKAIARFLELKSQLTFLTRAIDKFDAEYEKYVHLKQNTHRVTGKHDPIFDDLALRSASDKVAHHVDYIFRAFAVIERSVEAR